MSFALGHGKCSFKRYRLARVRCRPPISNKALAPYDIASEDPHTKRCAYGMRLRRTKVRYERAGVHVPLSRFTGNGTRIRTHRNTDERNESIPFADATIESVVMPSLTVAKVRLGGIASENERIEKRK